MPTGDPIDRIHSLLPRLLQADLDCRRGAGETDSKKWAVRLGNAADAAAGVASILTELLPELEAMSTGKSDVAGVKAMLKERDDAIAALNDEIKSLRQQLAAKPSVTDEDADAYDELHDLVAANVKTPVDAAPPLFAVADQQGDAMTFQRPDAVHVVPNYSAAAANVAVTVSKQNTPPAPVL